MNKKLVLAGLLILGLAGYAAAEMNMPPADSKATEAPAAAVNVGNKICPISGEKIVMGKEGHVVYKGKEYNLCCNMCLKDFNKDPEKAIQTLKDKGEIK